MRWRHTLTIAAVCGLVLAGLVRAQVIPQPTGVVGNLCAYNSTLPAGVSGQSEWVQCDLNGRVIVTTSSTAPIATTSNDYIVTPPGTSAPLGVPIQPMNGSLGLPPVDAGNTSLGTGSGTCSATCVNTDMIASTDTSGYGGGQMVISVTAFSGSATLTPATSNDNSTFNGTPTCWQENAGDLVITTITAAGVYICNIDERYFRLRWTVYGSGTQTGFWVMRPNPYPTNPSITPVNSAAAENNHVLKASAGNLVSVYATNQTATAGFLLVLNATSAPGDGAVTPVDCVELPGNSTASISNIGGFADRYGTGITAVLSSGANCFTKTTGVITGFIKGKVR